MKHILLPTDFSENAWSAAVYAFKLYANEECDFHFLHSINIKASSMSSMSNKLSRTMAENAMKDLVNLKETAENTTANTNHNFHIILSNNDIEDAIDSTIKKHKIDLIIMGTKGATKAKEFFFGSNAVNIIKNIKNCPVLVVPDEYEFVKPTQIAFPTDFNRFYGEELTPLKRLSEIHNSKINVFHINEKENLTDTQNYNLSMLNVNLEDYPHTFHWTPDHGEKTEEINDFITEKNINILTIINYTHSFIENIINEPIIKKIGFHPIVPFLVIPGQD